MKSRILGALSLAGALAALILPMNAEAGNWTSQTLGTSPPLWYEYRASVNDSGVIAASRLNGVQTEPIVSRTGSAVTVLSTPALVTPSGVTPALPAVTQGAAMDITSDDRVVGFRAAAHAGYRQASWWLGTGGTTWVHRDLHAPVPGSFPQFTISAAYGISAVDSNQYYVTGYVRKRIEPQSLSKPALWTVNETSMSVRELPLPAGTQYGIAYGVSDRDRANVRYACGGVGSAGGFMQAQCWDVTNPASPTLVARHANLTSMAGVATSVVNRVRMVDLGGTGTGTWQGKQAIAVGYVTYTSGGTAGFVWNLTTDTFDIHAALSSNYDAILSDVTKQSFTQNAARENSTSGAVYHGPLVVGTGGSASGRIAASARPDETPATVRAIYQARLTSDMTNATQAQTCNMATEVPSSPGNLEVVSGVSRNAMHMVGSSDGQLVRLTNALTSATINLYQRNARIYTGPATANYTTQSYHWATVSGHANAKIMWSSAAGCSLFQTGAVCPAALASAQVRDADVRATGLMPAAYTYVQASNLSGSACNMTPVYAVADLGVTTNPSVNTPTSAESWADCSANRSRDTQWGNRIGSGHNIDRKKDFFHCGDCNNSCFVQNRTTSCSDGSCNYGACHSGWATLTPSDTTSACDCPLVPGADRPEHTAPFTDQNCDGIDGTVSNSIFVATTGVDDSTCGTMTSPCRTVQYGVDRATSGKDVLVSRGTYNESVTLKNGVNIYGGYDAAQNWKRDVSYTVTINSTTTDSGHGWAVRGTDITTATTLNQVTILAPNATGSGTSSVAVACETCNGLTLAYVTAIAGAGTAGVVGTAGASGTVGMTGGTGATASGQNRGAGGTRTCSFGTARSGGGGGNGGGWHLTSCDSRAGSNGSAGASGSPAAGGGGASGKYTCSGVLCCPRSGSAGNGSAGGGGNVGANGSQGSAGARASHSVLTLVASTAGTGANGVHGSGGGGGGGGAGNLVSNGGGGGGGGAGGCAGLAGLGGSGGGSSVGILLVSSPSAKVVQVRVETSSAGGGGGGGTGGAGATGANGGNGVLNGSDGRGGNGGRGGDGGAGGRGGGGAGGDRACVMTYGGTLSTTPTFSACVRSTTAVAGGAPNGLAGQSVNIVNR